MTAARRLAALETSLTPTRRVLAWLDEAHAFGSLDAYVDSLLDQPPEAFPLNRLTREAAGATRKTLRGKSAEVVDAAVRKTLRATVFRFELVLRINVVGHDMLDREQLLQLAFAGQLGTLVSADRRQRRGDPEHVRRIAQCRQVMIDRVNELLAAEQARAIAEERYLDRHPALFPETAATWGERVHEMQKLAVLADGLAEHDGAPLLDWPDPEAVSAQVDALVADLVEPARSTALDKLDEGRQALAIATGWLRAKRSSAAPGIVDLLPSDRL